MHLDAFHEDNKIHAVLKEHKCTMNGEGEIINDSKIAVSIVNSLLQVVPSLVSVVLSVSVCQSELYPRLNDLND